MMTYSTKRQPLWEAARAHGLRRGVTGSNTANRALGFLFLFPLQHTEIPVRDELQLKIQLLVRESLMALMRLNDEIVMTPEIN
ncbi:hypothetical protein ACNKHX_11890 [Shigella flexneri]